MICILTCMGRNWKRQLKSCFKFTQYIYIYTSPWVDLGGCDSHQYVSSERSFNLSYYSTGLGLCNTTRGFTLLPCYYRFFCTRVQFSWDYNIHEVTQNILGCLLKLELYYFANYCNAWVSDIQFETSVTPEWMREWVSESVSDRVTSRAA